MKLFLKNYSHETRGLERQSIYRLKLRPECYLLTS